MGNLTPLYSLATKGLDADLIKIEVEQYKSVPGMIIVGLADTAVQESRERVRAAIKNSDFEFPRGRVVINLAPANVKKSGPSFDLPIALSMIALSKNFTVPDAEKTLFFGELSLDGTLRHVNGILGLMSIAKKLGFKKAYVPNVNAEEASLIPELEIYGIQKLSDLVHHFEGSFDLEQIQAKNLKKYFEEIDEPLFDLSEIKGQSKAKRGLEIAAAGSHNILLSGPPGTGKTMLGRALQGILPPLRLDESLEITKLYSLAGLLPKNECLIRKRPFRVIHHSASSISVVGGGRVPRPGEISLAHRGVLFLDEMPEFSVSLLELLRQPLEDKTITISRTQATVTYPAQIILCGAMNPCPCGYFGVMNAKKPCRCRPHEISRYQNKISGPLLDRIDLFCDMNSVAYRDLRNVTKEEESTSARDRVIKAWKIQEQRFQKCKIRVNSEMNSKDIKKYCKLEKSSERILEQAMENMHLSARGFHRVLKVSRTIADLSGREKIEDQDVLEALQYRKVD